MCGEGGNIGAEVKERKAVLKGNVCLEVNTGANRKRESPETAKFLGSGARRWRKGGLSDQQKVGTQSAQARTVLGEKRPGVVLRKNPLVDAKREEFGTRFC